MPLIELATFPDVHAAHLARAALETAGVPALLFDAGFSGLLGGGGGGVRLMVDEDDADDARALLDLPAT